jgi:aminomethyltransferase
LQSPLHQAHVNLGAKFAEFGGWLMPLEYAGGGVVAEHNAVRERVGVFDVSHLGTALISGPNAIALLNDIFTNDLAKVAAGQAQYTLLLSDDGGVIDDLIVYRISDDEALLIPNAANAQQVLTVLRGSLPAEIDVVDWHTKMAVIAVQGPLAPDLMASLGLPVEVDYLSFRQFSEGEPEAQKMTMFSSKASRSIKDVDLEQVFIARTGYTGEVGYEIVFPATQAPKFWDELLVATAKFSGLPVGLGARDTLRTEMGYALHGHEISGAIDPLQARLNWAIGWHKPAFHGKAALETLTTTQRLAGLKAQQRAVLRRGMSVLSQAGDEIGQITSGTFSPTLQSGIALALIDEGVSNGDLVQVDVRGRLVQCEVLRPPFVSKDPRQFVSRNGESDGFVSGQIS